MSHFWKNLFPNVLHDISDDVCHHTFYSFWGRLIINLSLDLGKYAESRQLQGVLTQFVFRCDTQIALVVRPHQVSDLHHFGEVVRDVLLVVNAEQTVRNIVVYSLFVSFK